MIKKFLLKFAVMGRILMIIGLVIIIIGAILHFGPKIPFLGKLPGDIVIKKDGFRFYFPLMTSVIVSILLSLIIYLFQKLR